MNSIYFQYLNDIAKYPLLTREQEKVLIELSATITRDKIVRHRAFRRDFGKSVAMKPPRLRVRFISTLLNERLQKKFPHQVQE